MAVEIMSFPAPGPSLTSRPVTGARLVNGDKKLRDKIHTASNMAILLLASEFYLLPTDNTPRNRPKLKQNPNTLILLNKRQSAQGLMYCLLYSVKY